MALIWFDGFETYNNYNDFNVVKNTAFSNIVMDTGINFGDYGRRSSRGMSFNGSINWYLSSTYVSFIIGVAYKWSSAGNPTYPSSTPIFALYDDTTAQLAFFCVGSEIAVYRSSTLLGTSSGAGMGTDWAFVEFKVLIDNSSGYVVINVNGNEVLNLTSQDTQESSNAYFNRILMARGVNHSAAFFDDLYFCDLTGSTNNNFLGDIRIDVIRPESAGSHTDFTPSTGSNYENVDEIYPDDDTTYNEGSNIGDMDSYTLSDLPSPPSGADIYGVKSGITVRKTDAGSRAISILTRSGGSDYFSSIFSLGDTYNSPTKLYEVNPADSGDWEDADVNGLETGIKIVTPTTTTA